MWMSAASLKTFVRMTADETISLTQSQGVNPDPVLPPLVKIFAEGQVAENLNTFEAELLSEKEKKFKPHGEKVTEFDVARELRPNASKLKHKSCISFWCSN